MNTLNRIYKDAKLPQDLYYKLKDVIKNNYDPDQQREIAEFLDDLPYRAKVKTIMCIYQSKYECITYLSDKSDTFLSWICPLLKQEYCPMDQYLYYETDQIVEIYFLTYGQCGFVLPLVQNMIYINISEGDYFGEIDFVFEAKKNFIGVNDMIQ